MDDEAEVDELCWEDCEYLNRIRLFEANFRGSATPLGVCQSTIAGSTRNTVSFCYCSVTWQDRSRKPLIGPHGTWPQSLASRCVQSTLSSTETLRQGCTIGRRSTTSWGPRQVYAWPRPNRMKRPGHPSERLYSPPTALPTCVSPVGLRNAGGPGPSWGTITPSRHTCPGCGTLGSSVGTRGSQE
jgi:hypothetical protein